jgi:hypothetical protein
MKNMKDTLYTGLKDCNYKKGRKIELAYVDIQWQALVLARLNGHFTLLLD